jgi:hypothetical protein
VRRFTVETIARLTPLAERRDLGRLWLAHGPMPGETVADLMQRAGGRAADLLEFLRGAGVVPRPSVLDERRLH